MNKKYVLVLSAVTLVMLATTGCKKDEKPNETAFSQLSTDQTELTTSTVSQSQATSTDNNTATVSTAASSANTTSPTQTTKKQTTTLATTAAPTSQTKNKPALSSSSGSKLINIKSAYEQDGSIYLTCVYMEYGKEIKDEDESWVEPPHQKDGNVHTFELSKNASISFSDDYGPDLKNISANQFVEQFNAMNDGSGANYVSSINGSSVGSLKFYYVP